MVFTAWMLNQARRKVYFSTECSFPGAAMVDFFFKPFLGCLNKKLGAETIFLGDFCRNYFIVTTVP